MKAVASPAPRPYAALPLGWAALLLYLTLAPADRLPPQPKWELLSFDTFAHAAFFAVQAGLTWFSLRRQTRWPLLARHAGRVVLLGCTLFGAVIEALQMALPFNRHGEWSDLLSDCLGTALALGLCRLVGPMMQRRGWLLGLLAAALAMPVGAQDMGRARKTIATLASPNMHGRGYVKQGEHKAAVYLRERLGGLGLQPLAADYMQPFTLDVNTFPGKIKLETSSYPMFQPGDPGLQPGRDYIVAPNSPATRWATWGLALKLDSLVFSDTTATAKLFHTNLRGRVLVLDEGQQVRLKKLPTLLQQHLASANAWITLASKLTASVADTQEAPTRLEVLKHRWQPRAGENIINIRVDAELKRNYSTQNLCAILPGRTQPDSFLIISAHYDHLGMMGRKVCFPGANDNASGVAMLLELAAHYAKPENRPACSVVFLLFGAEEAGLVGSRYFVAHPLVPLPRIKFLLNLDLLGTGEEGATVVNGKVFPAAFEKLTKINEAHHYLPSLGARGKAANSDHFPFSEAGVPAFFLYTRGGSKAYHDVNDRPEALSLAGFAGAFGLVRDFLDGMGAK